MKTAYQPSTSFMAKIRRKALPFRARRMLNFSLDKPIVSFTFDDFPRSAISNGSDILEAENWRATFYVAAGLEGIDNHHGEHFCAEDIPALAQRGHEIAGHTYTHIDCEHIGLDSTLSEIDRNVSALKSMGLTNEIENFAYPFGVANAALKHGLQSRFLSMRGVRTGLHNGQADLNDLKSCPLYSGDTLTTALGYINDLTSTPGWLVLFAHDIQTVPSEWGCTPQEFCTVIDAVKKSGVQVLPVNEALKILRAHAS